MNIGYLLKLREPSRATAYYPAPQVEYVPCVEFWAANFVWLTYALRFLL